MCCSDLLDWLGLLLSELYFKRGGLAIHCIELHQIDEVSLVLNHQLYLGSLVDEKIVGVQKLKVLS